MLLVPARLPVLLLALAAAVIGHLTAAAFFVWRFAGDFGGAAVGAVAEGGRGVALLFGGLASPPPPPSPGLLRDWSAISNDAKKGSVIDRDFG